MIESFVDLTYRGLSLGRRIKLTQVRPSTGYVETPAPMPVGTSIAFATDEGLTFDAVVMAIHEQVGGSDKAPGMVVAPALADAERTSWWKARVALPEEPPASTRPKPVTVRPRPNTVPQPPPDAMLAEAAASLAAAAESTGSATIVTAPLDLEDPAGRTTVMPAITSEMIEKLTRKSDEIPAVRASDQFPAVRITGEHAVVDDGKKTTVMEAITPEMLAEIEASQSGSFPTADDDELDDPRKSSPGLPSSVKKRKKKR